jgi:hypothetical protein
VQVERLGLHVAGGRPSLSGFLCEEEVGSDWVQVREYTASVCLKECTHTHTQSQYVKKSTAKVPLAAEH